MTEQQVLNSIIRKLETFTMTGDVVWYSRMNSGRVQKGRSWIKLAKEGTPDIVAVINCMDGRIALLFLEVKRPGVTQLRYEQQKFFDSMADKPMTLCCVINDPNKLFEYIKQARSL